MDLKALQAELADLERDQTLEEEANLNTRARALDFVAFVEQVARARGSTVEILALKQRADSLRRRLVPIDKCLFSRLRERIRTGDCTRSDLRREFDRFTAYSPSQAGQPHFGFDGLDVLLDGVLDVGGHPEASRPQHSEMIHYEPTPARVVLDLADHVGIQQDDVFYDLGSGLGRVAILFHLVSGIKAKGVEYQPDYCSYARSCARALRLSNVDFLNADARSLDYADGTVFFLFTPFKGTMLQSVIEKLRREAQTREIKVCTYGSCTHQFVSQPWVRSVDPSVDHEYKLAIFRSR